MVILLSAEAWGFSHDIINRRRKLYNEEQRLRLNLENSKKLTIDTLIPDIQSLLLSGVDVPEDLADRYAGLFKNLLVTRLKDREKRGTLRMSSIGKPCERQLYYSVNHSDEGEELPPSAYMKFLFGDLCELLLLFLVEASGHSVEGTQDEQEIEGIKGHRDAVIDGTIVDVKSASTFSFKKFEDGTLEENDSFGYIDQLQSYLYAGQTDDKVTDKDRAAFLVLDKTLGHICLDVHQRKDLPYDKIFAHKKEVVNASSPPPRGFDPVPDGASGNEKLNTQCSYCDFKQKCHPNLRTFLYSNGPRFLTEVKKLPNVPEIS